MLRDEQAKPSLPSQQSQDSSNQKQSAQVKALLIKNFQLQSKQVCTNICQILTPIICLIFTYLINKLASENIPTGASFADNPYPYIFNNYTLFDQYSLNVNKNGTKEENNFTRNNPLEWFIYQCDSANCDSGLLGAYDGSQPYEPGSGLLLQEIPNTFTTSIQNYTPEFYENPNNTQAKFVPFFLKANATINKELFNRLDVIQTHTFQAIEDGRDGLDYLPDGTIEFQQLSKQRMKVHITANDARDLDLHRNNGVTKIIQTQELKDQPNVYGTGIQDIISGYGLLSVLDLANRAYILTQSSENTRVQSGYVFMRDTSQSKSFIDSIINTISALIFPLALSLLFPVFLYGIVLEKEERLVQMMKMNGLKISNYWLVYFIYNFLLALLTSIIFFLMGALILKTAFFEKTSVALLIIVTIGWILAQIGLAAFLQTFLSKARTANIIGYIVAIWTTMISSTLSLGVYQVPSQFPLWLNIIPPFAFNRLFYLMLSNCSDADCYNTLSEISPEIQRCILFLYLGFLFYFLLGAYLFEVLPQEFGVSRHPLFPFISFYRFITCKSQYTYTRTEKDKQIRNYISEDEEDPFSKEERDTVAKISQPKDYPLVINNLRKLYKKQGYKGDFAAVKSFNLKVESRQTFGLLGPNGAGKTTLISMITGMIKPNYGNAWIGGYDIANEIEKSQLQMGVCPQFDLLWPQLSVQQHLTFYARLKGVSSSDLEARVTEAIEEVNLIKHRNFAASSLSGGMKRRLSIAISLVGNPRIVFLDEPSTGLDPDNRRQLWEVLAKCQEKRALFLTTHMMEEADALCHRIGILTRGTLRTLGTPIKLKKYYGQGLRLNINLRREERRLVSAQSIHSLNYNNLQGEEENLERLRGSISELSQNNANAQTNRLLRVGKKVSAYIMEKFPGAQISKVFRSTLIFKIPITFKVSEMFEEMHSIERALDIANLSITNSSLQDVFIAVVLKYDKLADDEEEEQGRIKPLVESKSSIFKSLKRSVPRNELQEPERSKSVSEEDKLGSVIEKSRESVMSEQELKRRNRGGEDD